MLCHVSNTIHALIVCINKDTRERENQTCMKMGPRLVLSCLLGIACDYSKSTGVFKCVPLATPETLERTQHSR